MTDAVQPRFSPPPPESLTPAMRQYWEQKQQTPDAILLFRMGDFYELFYDDAERGAKLLGITLTSRDGGRTPLAGIPHHALEGYLAKLVAAGCKVAISEQVEDAKQAKGVVKRDIVRVVTPGTLTDDGLLDQQSSNLLAAVCEARDAVGVAALELSTGHFRVQSCEPGALVDELTRLAPAEVLLAEPVQGRAPLDADLRERVGCMITYRPPADFAAHWAERLLTEQFAVRGLAGFGFDKVDASLQAAGALLSYVRETQRGAAVHIQPPRRYDERAHMQLDPATLRSLEVVKTVRGAARQGSLLAAVDETSTPMGARLLRQWLCYPLRDIAAIERRQRMVGALRDAAGVRESLRAALERMGDLERMVGRVGVQRTTPRDLRALGDGVAQFARLRDVLAQLHSPDVEGLTAALAGLDELATRICATLQPEAPTTMREGGLIASQVDDELDRLRGLHVDGEQWLGAYQAREAERLGVPNLKIGFNKVFGFYIEVTNPHKHRVPAAYVRKQTVKNAERFITDELKRHETEVLSAESRANELEYELFTALRNHVERHTAALLAAAAALAELDVLAGWAELSIKRRYTLPQFVDEPVLEISAGRHPVVEQTHEHFVANDTMLRVGGRSLAIITGPNMAGKSTYIRQTALLALLAHCGGWVSADAMRLGVVDRIFTRIGASDELSRGQSTFMVEMLETANILHNATPASLVILDEVGRGTSTYDGLALAWAIAEHLATQVGCRALFATHYHEMTELEQLLDGVLNLNVAVREYEDQLVFLHRIVAGAADRSYGLHVAQLAGVPPRALERAHAVLAELERSFARESQRPTLAAAQRRRIRQLRLFEEPEEAVVRQLREVDLGRLDPEAAAALVHRLRSQLDGR